jgi:hypothetical protein
MAVRIDLVGCKYGRLTVLRRLPDRHWECLCDCGTTTVVQHSNLVSGHVKSCGCYRRERSREIRSLSLAGQRFGRLTVIRQVAGKDKYTWWECKCDCGAIVSVRGTTLLKGTTRSCGCARGLPYGESAFEIVYRAYRNNARQKGMTFSLSKACVREIIQQSCHYCGAPPSNTAHSHAKKHDKGVCVYSGLDRVDNARGYELDNIVPCCDVCNKAKRDMGYEEFIGWLNRVTQFRSSQ